MTAYLASALWFVAGAAVAGGLLAALARRRPHLGALLSTALALVGLTAVFDSLMIAAGLFRYAPEHLLGIEVGLAPLEDFSYPIAGVLLLPALWTALCARRRGGDRTDEEAPA